MEVDMAEPDESQLTRRNFLGGLGASLAGLTATGLMSCSFKDHLATPPSAEQSMKSTPQNYPFTYVKLDPDKAAEMAYNAYFKGG
jgi:hypothetical protein